MADSNNKAGETSNTPNSLQSLKLNHSKLNEQVNYSTDNKYQINRVPWVLTCQKWLDETDYKKMIVFSVNPENVGWQLKIRGSEVKQRMGSVLHMWRNKIKGTYFDEPRLNITFQSGSISTYLIPAGIEGAYIKKIPDGLYNFYLFLELVDSQRMYSTTINGKEEQRLNTLYLTYHSNIFPEMTLSGYFDPSAFSFTDSSSSGQIDSWTSTFVVTDSYPKLTGEALSSMATSYGGGNEFQKELNKKIKQDTFNQRYMLNGKDTNTASAYDARQAELDAQSKKTFGVERNPKKPTTK